MISSKMTELPIPMTFNLVFAYNQDKKRLSVSCSEPGYEYAGQGCFVHGQTMFYIPGLDALDALTEDGACVPGRYLDRFMRDVLPSIRRTVPADCLLQTSEKPPVEMTVLEWTGSQAVLDVVWRVPRASLKDCGCPGFCLAGDTLFPGDWTICKDLPFQGNGRFVLDGPQCLALETLVRNQPELFGAIFAMPQKAEPIIRPEAAPHDGTPLLSLSVSPAAQDPPARYLDFVKEARLLKDRQDEPAPAALFSVYWPTYAMMTPGQKQWYFYWRGRALDGEYLSCSLSYLFVFVYELINNIHDNGLKRLYALWEACRGDHPELDIYLPPWIMDYILVYHADSINELSGLIARFPLRRLPLLQYSEVFFSEQMKRGLSALPAEIMLAAADYDLAECKVPHDQLCRAVKGLESSFARGALPLMQSFRPLPFTLMRESFRGAVKGRRANRVIKAVYLPYFTQPGLRRLLKNALRFGENILRSDLGVPGRYKVSGLSPDMKDCIARAMMTGQAAETPRLEVDVEIARAIEAVSWEMTKQLIVDDEDVVAPEENAPAACGAESGQSFAAALSVTQRAFLQALLRGDSPNSLCERAFMLPEAVAERINELACDYFGEPVIDTSRLEIYSEYVSAITDQFMQENLPGDFRP